MRLFIIRHGDPDYAVDGLTEKGKREAQALAKRMRALSPDRLYSSPKGRARATAKYTEEALGKTAQILDWTREISEWETQQPPFGRLMAWDTPAETLRGLGPNPDVQKLSTLPQLASLDLAGRFAAIGKESDSFLEGLGFKREGVRYQTLSPSREKVAVFCHGGFGLAWLSHLLQIPLGSVWSSFWLAPTSVTTILFEEKYPSWVSPRCVGLCDVSHLYAEGLTVTPHGLKANVD
jgi:broad specificity phosphatase PhoE